MSEPPSLPSPYSVKQHGEMITDRDAEPIHAPGCIQSHGVLLALRPRNLTITQVSENCAAWVGWNPDALLGRSVAALIGRGATARLRTLLEREPVELNPLYAFTIDGGGLREGAALDVTVHSVEGVVLAELEAGGRNAGAAPGRDYYGMVTATVAQLAAARTLRDFFQIAARETRRMTRLDRVMVYKLHPDGSAEVFAEEKREELAPWLGLRLPAGDIPRPVREIFKRIWIRPLPDTASPPHEMVPLVNPDNRRPLDMTHCTLRGASRLETEHLRELGVASSLTLAILRDGELWGVITGHHATPLRYPYPVRAAVELLAQTVSLQLKSAEDREHQGYRARLDAAHHGLLAQAAAGGGLAAMAAGNLDLLAGIAATGAAVCDGEGWRTVGATPDGAELAVLGEWLLGRPELAPTGSLCFATDRLAEEIPAAAAYRDAAAGVLAVLVAGAPRHLILWFRRPESQTFRWAGRPQSPPPAAVAAPPRHGFALWEEEIGGRCAPWTPVEIDAALKLRRLAVDLVAGQPDPLLALNVELARDGEETNAFPHVAVQNLEEPLRGVHQYAHYLLTEAQAGRALDARSIERIETLLRLTIRMDGLLDALLHFSRTSLPPHEPWSGLR